MTIGAGGEGDGPILAPRRGRSLRLDEVQAVWWRRPQPFVLHDDLRGENRRIFAWREAREAFAGMWQSLDVRWVNNLARDEAAMHKPWQLTLAERLGLRVPRTCITSDPARARAFVESVRPGRAVFKSLRATRADWRATRLVRPKELGCLDVVRYAPVIFQEYVEAGVDVRGHRRRPPTLRDRNPRLRHRLPRRPSRRLRPGASSPSDSRSSSARRRRPVRPGARVRRDRPAAG